MVTEEALSALPIKSYRRNVCISRIKREEEDVGLALRSSMFVVPAVDDRKSEVIAREEEGAVDVAAALSDQAQTKHR